MSPGKAWRNAVCNPEGTAISTARGGTGQAACAEVATATANTADMTQIHFIAPSFPDWTSLLSFTEISFWFEYKS